MRVQSAAACHPARTLSGLHSKSPCIAAKGVLSGTPTIDLATDRQNISIAFHASVLYVPTPQHPTPYSTAGNTHVLTN